MHDAASQMVPLRIVVKFQPGLDQSFVRALKPGTNTVDLAMATAADPRVAALVVQHGIQAVKPVFGHHALQRATLGLSEAMIQQNTRRRFSLRAARASGAEIPPDLSASYVLDLGLVPADKRDKVMKSLRSNPDVIYAEEDRTVTANFSPNDPDYVSGDLYGLNVINCSTAWNSSQGSGVVVAVVDTGVDYNHPDIHANIWSNPHPGENGYVNDTMGWDFIGSTYTQPVQGNNPYDRFGHGSHVAGTIAAVGDNSIGIIGVAWQARIMIVKALDDTGNGVDSTLSDAIVYAADEGADVINASWGESGMSQTLKDAVDYAHGMGVVIVAAAGNNNVDASGFCPANLPNVIAVAATDESNQKASFSNYGDKIDLAAPGVDILSLQAGTTNYITMSGTSMAAPHVSGVAALILALHPTFTNEQVRQALRTSADQLGTAGHDIDYGYGLVNAAQALQVTAPLEAKIFSPMEATVVSSAVALTGSAQGPGFASYTVDYGSGGAPASWTVIQSSTTSVSNGSIGTFNAPAVPDGLYTVRLRAVNSSGQVFSDQIQVNVQCLVIASPPPPAVHAMTTEVKPGATLQITGTATGPGFKNYKLQWAPGVGATSGWSTAGITLANGNSPVNNGLLGTWAVPSTASGDYTIQLVVTNSSFSNMEATSIYCEPALISPAFPLFLGPIDYMDSALPAKPASGATRLIHCNGFNYIYGTTCYSYAMDGTSTSVTLSQGSDVQPAVGQLDGAAAGDEVVLSDRFALKIFSANLAPVRTITTARQQMFGVHLTELADLDNDGIPEIITIARDCDSTGSFYVNTGALYVYKSNGTFFSSNYPLTIASPLTPAGFSDVKFVATDLNHDGRKEILLAVENLAGTSYTLEAFNADGTPYQPWPTPSFSANGVYALCAADLNHDGKTEIILTETQSTGPEIRVLNSDGTVRPGWPVTMSSLGPIYTTAVGDLNGDGRKEIVVGMYAGLYVLNQDGTTAPGWPLMGTFYNPVVADLNNDGKEEIIVSHETPIWTEVPYLDIELTEYNGAGSILGQWPLFGTAGRQAFLGVPVVGDFNGDGKTDIAVKIALIEGGGNSGWVQNGVLTVLTTGTTFDPGGSDWVSNFRDPQDTSVIPDTPIGTVVSAGGGFSNTPISPSQSGIFTVTFDASPSLSPSNATIALSKGSQTAYTGLSCIARFNPSGDIDAYNGSAANYQAASVIPYAKGATYHFRMAVNVPANTYSVYVTPPGGSELTVGLNYGFRKAATSLDTWNIDVNTTPGGSVTVSNLSVSGSGGTVAAPSFSPGAGTYSSAQTVIINDSTSGATIRYTTDGSKPGETNGAIYSGSFAIAASATLQAIAYKSGMMDSAVTSGSYTINGAARSLTGSSSNGFQSLALTSAQTGTFTATFDATPTVLPENAVVGLSKGVATAYTGISCIARFNPTGDIDAYNGTAYAAASTIPYSAGVSYHFRLVVNVSAHTYSVYVTPAGGSELTVGLNYAFRTTPTSLDTWSLDVNSTPSGCSLTATNLNP